MFFLRMMNWGNHQSFPNEIINDESLKLDLSLKSIERRENRGKKIYSKNIKQDNNQNYHEVHH